jgi:hypothetical protein
MMAVHTSNVEPLPHQITAVYESMLPRQPLRFVLADDPGAGKTIMAGLYIRELIMRADARRVLIVAPGSLVEQWRDELFEKFGLEFRVFSKELSSRRRAATRSRTSSHLIVRLDQLARDAKETRARAGKASARRVGPGRLRRGPQALGALLRRKVEATGRFKLAEKLGAHTRHLLLMTATPTTARRRTSSSSSRCSTPTASTASSATACTRSTRPTHAPHGQGGALKFDGTPLFPERRAYTVNYKLSDLEAALYERVTTYVKEQMGKADEARRPAPWLRRLRPDDPPAPARVEPRGHLPVAQAPSRPSRKAAARREARQPRSLARGDLGSRPGRRRPRRR